MGKLTPRYTPAEMSRMVECMKPVERWTKSEHRGWERSHYGFRHFTAPNITPIEHYKSEDTTGVFTEMYGYREPPPQREVSRAPIPLPLPPRKPAA